MATQIAVNTHQSKRRSVTKGHKRNLSTSMTEADNINVIEVNGQLAEENIIQGKNSYGVSQIQIKPVAVTAGKNKAKKAESNSTVHLTDGGREVNVISVQRPVFSGPTSGTPNVEYNKTTDVTRKDNNGVSLVKIRDQNSPASHTLETTEKEKLGSRGVGEYYSQCSIETLGSAVSHIDVSRKETQKLNNQKKRVPVIDIKGMLRQKVGKPTTVELPPEPRVPNERVAITDIPPLHARPIPPVTHVRIPETAILESRMQFQGEPRMDEGFWATQPVAHHPGNQVYTRPNEPPPNHYTEYIDSEVHYDTLKESRGMQTRHSEPSERYENRTYMTNGTSSFYDSLGPFGMEQRERSTQTNSEIGTQTIPVLEPEIHVLTPREESRFSEEDDVTELYTQIRDVDRERKKSKKKQKEECEKKPRKEKKNKEERNTPERSNSTRSNRAVPAVLKPRSELRKQIVAESLENVEVSDSESEKSTTTLDSASTGQTLDENKPPARERRKMKRLSRLDQVKKPVVSRHEIRDADPVPARVNLRDRPQLLGVFSIKTYSSHPRSKCRPTGLAISPGGNYIITDHSDKTVKIFNKSGQVKVEFGEKKLVKPWGVTLLDDGNIAVSDPGDTSVKVFTRKGKYVKKFEFANLVEPYGITRSNAGDILVADKGANGLYVFDSNGFLKGSLGNTGDSAIAEWPQYVTVDTEDNIIISDYMSHTVRIFSPAGNLLKEHGGMGTGTGQLMCPQGICVDKYGHILVADNINSRVKILSPQGEFIRDLITSKSGLEGPEAVAIDQDGNLVVTEGISGEVKLFSYVM